MKLFLVAGARPNFMKIAPIARALDANGNDITYSVVHTGQHYDREMSQVLLMNWASSPPTISWGWAAVLTPSRQPG